jgi:hypothetical protein
MIIRNIKKVIVAVIAILLIMNESRAQVNLQDTASLIIKPPIVYWGFTSVTFRLNTKTRDIMYFVKPTSTRIYFGDEIAFVRNLWDEGRNKRLTLGPYWDEQQANLAMNIYQMYSRISPLKIAYDPDRVVYWFYINLEEKRAGFRWKTTEAGISSGNIDEFRLNLKNGTEVGLLAIGPFFHYVEVQSAFEIFSK